MSSRSPPEPFKNPGADSDVGPRFHEYQFPTQPFLEPATEQQLWIAIKRGGDALEAIGSSVVSGIAGLLEGQNFEPLSAETVLDVVRTVVSGLLVKHAALAGELPPLGDALIGAIREQLADSLEDLASESDIDCEGWLDERLPKAKLLQVPSTHPWDHSDHWTAAVAREAAINKLAESHLPLAKPFAFRAMRQPFEFDDLMGEAFLIQRHAAERFEPSSKNRFACYAQTALKRELPRKSPSKIGVKRHTQDQMKKFADAEKTLSQKRRCSVTSDEVYEQLGYAEKTRSEIDNVRRLLNSYRRSQQKGEASASDHVAAQLTDPLLEVIDQEARKRLHRAFIKLGSLEKRVLVGKINLRRSFRQMGKRYRKSPRTLSDLYDTALAKLARRIDPEWEARPPR